MAGRERLGTSDSVAKGRFAFAEFDALAQLLVVRGLFEMKDDYDDGATTLALSDVGFFDSALNAMNVLSVNGTLLGVPEPATWPLVGAALPGVRATRRREQG